MNLHRAEKDPDWENIPAKDRSWLQRLAASTHGLVTPANLITLIGLLLVGYGLFELVNDNLLNGLILLAVGRLLDVADGMVAEATKTKSPLGEMFDAVADKIGTILTIVALFYINIAPWWVVSLLILPQVITAILVVVRRLQAKRIHPTRPGKLSMAFLWVAIVGFLGAQVLDGSPAVEAVAYTSAAISLALGLFAFWQYASARD